jgi:D-tyrosyl-tRNA(Tyr) deacylase
VPLDRLVDLRDRGRVDVVGGVHVENARERGLLGVVVDQGESLLVHARDRGVDRVRRGDPEAELNTEREPKLVRVHEVRRICHRDEQRVVGEELDRERLVATREVLRQEGRRVRVHLGLLELQERMLVLCREDARDLHARYVAALHENLAEALAGLALVHERALELVLGEVALAHEEISQRGPVVVGGRHAEGIGRPQGSREPEEGGNARVRAVLQRVREAAVTVDGDVVGRGGPGLVVLLGVARSDDEDDATRLAGKVVRLRVFENTAGRLDRSLADAGGEALVVSQFTLLADTRKGTRPSFTEAAAPDLAERLYERFCEALAAAGVSVTRGVFGARMEVSLVNDGPVTIVLDA